MNTATRHRSPLLARAAQQQKKRPLCVYDGRESLLTVPPCQPHSLTPQGQLSAILARLAGMFDAGSTLTLYVCAGTSAESVPPHEWYTEPALDGWTVTYRRESNPARRAGTYVGPNRPKIELRHTSAWFGDLNPSGFQVREALASLERDLEKRWHNRSARPIVLATPAQTGLDILEKTLPFEAVVPTLDLETAALIRRTTTQARIEQYAQEYPISSLYEYDQVFSYGARLGTIPMPIDAGHHYVKVEHTDARSNFPEKEMYRPARYLCIWQVPKEWNHVGLLPELMDGWTWPSRPGSWHQGWLDNREVLLARQHNWTVKIHEGLLFGMPDKTRKYDPLREWRTLLLALWKDYALWELDGDEIAGLCKVAIRAMVLGAIGTWHKSTGRATVVVPRGAPLPPLDDMLEPPVMTRDGLEYVSRTPVHRSQQKWQHPEWSSSIWADQRVTLTEELLTQDPTALIGCNTDGYYSTSARVATGYQGMRPGYWRLKAGAEFTPPMPWPETASDLAELRLLARGA